MDDFNRNCVNFVNMASNVKESLSSDVIEFLNSEFGSDISKLSKIHEVLERITKYEEELEIQVCPDKKDFSKVVGFTRSAEDSLEDLTKRKESHENLLSSAKAELVNMSPTRNHFVKQINSVNELENLHCYLQWIVKIEDENSHMEEALKIDEATQLVETFVNIKGIWGHLNTSHCINLLTYVQKTMIYWHNVLKDKFEKKFQIVLSSLHWPVKTTNISEPLNNSEELFIKFKQLFIALYKLQLPDEYVKLMSDRDSVPIIFPLQLMLQPLQKRFLFHFMSKKLTNRLDKPEWYLTQILSWISDHTLFIDKHVQPFLNEENLHYIDARVELMKGLVQLGINRFQSDLPSLIEDDSLLSHAVDEILLFSQELFNQGYPRSYPSLLQQLAMEPCFARWRSLEHQSALEKMDKFLNSDIAWKSRYQDEGDLDDLRVPESAELFITLLLTMTERYCQLESKDCQVSFMELQLELLDDFRLRLHQLSQCQIQETIQANYCGILNAIYYIASILEEWNNSPFFLHLYTYVSKKNSIQEVLKANEMQQLQLIKRKESKNTNCEEDVDFEGSAFDEIIGLFEHMEKDLLQALSEHVMLDIKAKSRAYRKEKWFCLPTVQDKKLMEVSTASLPLLEIINTSLHSLQELLAKPLFTNVWQKVAMELNLFLYEEVILQSSFSEGGAAQLNFDITRNLFPIFGSYTLRPDNYFKLVKESCILLNLYNAPAMLLKETLKHEDGGYEAKTSALEEHGVHSLTPSQALIILSQRNDTHL